MTNRVILAEKSLKDFYTLGITSIFTLVAGLRLRGGIFRIPPDPGFDIIQQARPVTRISYFDISGSYMSITPRLIAKITAFFPVEFAAVIASICTLTIWVIVATICSLVIYRHSKSYFLAFICGLFCIANPAAGESSIGNYGNAIWQLFIAIVLVYSLVELVNKHATLVTIFTVILGLSHPWAILALMPLLGTYFKSDAKDRRLLKSICLVLILSFLIQISVFIATGDSARRSGITYWWTDMPLFWSFNLLFPPLLMLAVIILNVFIQVRNKKMGYLPTQLSITGLALSIVCYLQGGIADRYFVTPMTLAICASAVLFAKSFGSLHILPKSLFCIAIALVSVGSYRWFSASSYLNSGPTWHSEILRLRAECADSSLSRVSANLSLGSAELSCSDL